jgi:two-component system NtrC family sensor kinase
VSEELENALKIIEEQAYRCKQITKKLLDFGRTDYSMAALDISELVLETLAVVTHKAKRRGITLRNELSDGLPLVVTDRSHLQQVIMNLLDNAIDAAPEKRGHVTIRTMPVIPGSLDRVAISVSDDGHGIPPEDQGRIFDPFFTTKSKGTGTGLGLAIARSVIRRLGGKLYLESVPERGSIFRIELPVEEDGNPTSITGARGATPATTTP